MSVRLAAAPQAAKQQTRRTKGTSRLRSTNPDFVAGDCTSAVLEVADILTPLLCVGLTVHVPLILPSHRSLGHSRAVPEFVKVIEAIGSRESKRRHLGVVG